MARKVCSIRHLSRYNCTISLAAMNSSGWPQTGIVVSRRQTIGLWPLGGSISWTSTNVSITDAGSAGSAPLAGLAMHTRPALTLTRAMRSTSPGRCDGTRTCIAPNSRQSEAAANRNLSSSSLRFCAALTITEDDQLCRAAEPIAGDRRPLDPAHGFLLLDRPVPPRRHRLRRSGPDARMHDTQQSFVLGIDRYHRMAEKARRLTIAGRPESFARAITILEIDLRGVLRRHDPPSRTDGRGSLSRSGVDFLMRHIPRRKKTLCRHLSTPIASHSSQHQGSRLHHPLAQRRSRSLSPHIAKIA